MMNIQEQVGEPSCKRQENGDGSSGSDRPLKKARFAWQVKGKYHLKNDAPEPSGSGMSHEAEKPCSSSSSGCSNLVGNTEQNLEILGDYLLKQDFNTLDSVISDSEKTILKPSASLSTEKLDYPRYVSTFERSRSCSSLELEAVPSAMVMTHRYTEDQCIARWQARQMAKGCVDNTINRVLDSWMIAPLPASIDNRFLALDVAEFINNLPGDDSIENEGILMAISAHGLQNNSSSSSNDSNEEQDMSSKDRDCDQSPPPSSPMHSDEDSKYERNCTENFVTNASSCQDEDMAWFNNEKDNSTDFSLFPDNAHSSSLNYDDIGNRHNMVEYEENDLLTSHYDFMDAAVSFAIQNKGLTSFGTDYG